MNSVEHYSNITLIFLHNLPEAYLICFMLTFQDTSIYLRLLMRPVKSSHHRVTTRVGTYESPSHTKNMKTMVDHFREFSPGYHLSGRILSYRFSTCSKNVASLELKILINQEIISIRKYRGSSKSRPQTGVLTQGRNFRAVKSDQT